MALGALKLNLADLQGALGFQQIPLNFERNTVAGRRIFGVGFF